jgi:AcrR family transcriptional regulator
MPRPSREPEILDAALACFAELGYDATRVRHIAARAGVSEAALYRHHPSKEAVALALFATHMRRYAQRLQDIAVERDRPVADRVRAIARAALAARDDDPAAHAFVLGHQARFLGALPADFPYPIRILEALVREGQADGSVKPGPARLLAALVAGCMNHPAVVAQYGRRGTLDLADPAAIELVAEGAWAAIAASEPERSR